MSEEKEYFTDFPKWLRLTVLPWYLWVLLALTAVWATKAFAEEIPAHVLEKGGVVIRLMRGPCVDPRSQMMILSGLPTHAHRFKEIDSEWPMQNGARQKFAGCWAEFKKGEIGNDEDIFIVVFEDGTGGAVAKSEFTRKSGDKGA